jgi:hypothetical protein
LLNGVELFLCEETVREDIPEGRDVDRSVVEPGVHVVARAGRDKICSGVGACSEYLKLRRVFTSWGFVVAQGFM